MDTKEFIKKHEGIKYSPYKDTSKTPKTTIGIGWNMDANPLPPDIQDYLNKNGKIENGHIDRLLAISVNTARSDCRKLFPGFDNFSDNRKTALTDFVFQLGRTKANKFVRMKNAVNSGRWDDAAMEMRKSNYYDQVPLRAEEVSNLLEEG